MIIYGLDCETTGLSPFENELITVQYADEDGTLSLYRLWEYESEAALLIDFLRDWKEIKRKRDDSGALFVGYNHLKFDVPFVFAKCLLLEEVQTALDWSPQDCWKQLYRWPMYLDLVHLFGSDFISMEAIREELLGTSDPYESRNIPVYYANDQYDVIEAYIEDEMAALKDIFNAVQRTTFFTELMRFRREAGHERELL